MESTQENKKLAWFLLILLSVVWGASYILIKLSLKDTDGNQRLMPDQLGAVRMVIASLVLLPFFFKYAKNIKRKHIPFIVISGVCGNGLPAYLYAYAQMHLESAITGMLNSFVPIFAITISALIFGFKVKWNHLVGIVLGILGAYLIVYSKLMHVTLTKEEILRKNRSKPNDDELIDDDDLELESETDDNRFLYNSTKFYSFALLTQIILFGKRFNGTYNKLETTNHWLILGGFMLAAFVAIYYLTMDRNTKTNED